MEANLILIDWVSITSKIHSVADFLEMLGMGNCPWQTVKGAKGYKDRLYYDCISIHFNGSDDMGIWLEMSGQGCRAFESYGTGNYQELFQIVLDNPGEMKITRLDIAYDDHSGVLDLYLLCEDTKNNSFVSRFNDWEVRIGSKGSSVSHGSQKSEIYIRIYDKASERGYTDGRHWVRVELQLRRDRALAFVQLGDTIGSSFNSVLMNYLRYVEADELDSNRWRWGLKDYWANLVLDAEKISLYIKPGTEYNLGNLLNYTVRQAGNAIEATIDILGLDGFLAELKNRQTMKNPKYEQLVNKYKTREVF